MPASWAPNIVQGKTYDSTMAEGAALWQAVRHALAGHAGVIELCKIICLHM
jgi:hypothetical protein